MRLLPNEENMLTEKCKMCGVCAMKNAVCSYSSIRYLVRKNTGPGRVGRFIGKGAVTIQQDTEVRMLGNNGACEIVGCFVVKVVRMSMRKRRGKAL